MHVIVPFTTIPLGLMVTLTQSLLEKDSDVVGDTLELLITLRLCGLETTGYMAPDEGHGNGVGPGTVGDACHALLGLEWDGG